MNAIACELCVWYLIAYKVYKYMFCSIKYVLQSHMVVERYIFAQAIRFERIYKKKKRKKEVLFVCQSGCQRSGQKRLLSVADPRYC